MAMMAMAARGRARAVLPDLLALLLTATVVLGWFALLPNHMTIHAWFIGRLKVLPLSFGCVGVLLLVTWLRRPSPSIRSSTPTIGS